MAATEKNSYPPREAAPQESAGYGPSAEGGMTGTRPGKWRQAKRVLILDDDKDFLNVYKKIIGRLPSRPQVELEDDATRALALLEQEPFDLFITDLRMPKIDGFQVLLSAQQRLPNLKTVVMTAAGNEQYRARAYGSGIDLFTEKPTTPEEIRIFSECVEALLMRGERDGGFRGIQSKSLMDLVQIECLSQNSSVLRITCGSLEGRIWIWVGDVIDAEAQGMVGEEAFMHIFAWKTGNFESMPGDPTRERTIFAPYESLLLEGARVQDEAAAEAKADAARETAPDASGMSRELKPLSTVRGVESLIMKGEDGRCHAWKLDKAERFAAWTHRVLRDFQGVGEILRAGPLKAVQAEGQLRGFVMLTDGRRQLLAGMDGKMSLKLIRKARRELESHLGRE